jgi:hypothetical protein
MTYLSIVRATNAIMKYAFVFPLLALGCDLVAQPYIPLLDTTATWLDHNEGGDPGPNTSFSECYLYDIATDTTLNDTAYRILRVTGRRSSSQSVPPFNSSQVWYSHTPLAFLREDTASRKVYIREFGLPYDLLLYDFSVGLGPYPETYLYGQGWTVTAVDTVNLVDGPHRRISLGSSWEQIIEGIGRTRGFMPLQVDFFWLPWLVCHSNVMSENVFVTIGGCECGSNVGIAEDAPIQFRVSPSPTADLCHVQGAPANANLFLRNTTGGLLRTMRCNADGMATLDLSALPAGCYALTSESANGIFTARIVVAH